MSVESPPTDRVVNILDALAEDPGRPKTVSELARELNLSTATCYAIVGRLTAAGYLVPTGRSKRYALGPQAMAIGRAAQRGLVPSQSSSTLLDELSQALGYPCSIRRKVQTMIVVVDHAGELGRWEKDNVGQYPFAPPFGLSFVLWGDAEMKQEWISQAPFPLPLEEDELLTRVTSSAVRRGYAVHRLLSETRRQLHAAFASSTSEDLQDEPLRGLLAEVLKTMWTGAILLDDLEAGSPLRISSISAPIFDADQLLRWIIEVHVTDEVAVRTAEQIGRRVAATASAITHSIGGVGRL
jgi:DNA-binding IclR family transcriptional regulator